MPRGILHPMVFDTSPNSLGVILQQERQGRWCIFDTGLSHWIDYLVKEDMMKVAWPESNQIILVSGLKIVAKSQSELWRLITNSSAKFKADPVSGVYAKGYHMIGTNSANSAGLTPVNTGWGGSQLFCPNERKMIDRSKARKWQDLGRARPKVYQACEGP